MDYLIELLGEKEHCLTVSAVSQYIGLEVISKTVCGRDAAVEPTGMY
jgi:hypothetical protein